MLSRLRSFLDQWIISLQSYPVSHIVVIAMTVIWMVLIETGNDSTTFDFLWRCLLTGLLLLPLTIIRPKNWLLQAWVVIIGVIFYLMMPEATSNAYYAQAIWIAGSVIIAWILPSLSIAWDHRESQDLTWSQFAHRWTSLAQWVIGGLILWGGIAASLASIEFLFDVTIHNTIYQHIGVISVLCVWAWIWLINLQQQTLSPTDSSLVKEQQISYPRRMRIFWQYIFLPLCVIYWLILISYGIKIIATGTWPQGQLVYMVSGYVGFWLLTWFTLLPLERGNLWLSKAYRALFISFVVTSGLMVGALIMRVQQYGWTIDRGMVVALITWIMVIWVGSLIWTKRKWIIGLSSLVIIWAIAIFSLPSTIFNHHISKIQWLLTSTAILHTGDASTLYGSLDYLSQNYGTGRLGQVFNSEQVSQLSWSSTWDLARNTMTMLKISNYDTANPYDGSTNNYFSFYSNNQGIFDIAWYKTLMQIDNYSIVSNTSDGLSVDKNKFTIATWWVSAMINFDLHIDTFSNTQWKEQSAPYIITWDAYKLILTTANGQKDNWVNTLDWFGWYLLLK